MDEEDFLRKRLRTMQLIALALLAAAVVYVGVVLIVVANRAGGAPEGREPWLTWAALAFLLLQIVLASVFPAIQTRSAMRKVAANDWRPPPGSEPEQFKSDITKLLAIWHAESLCFLAPLEGAAFLGCIAYSVEGQTAALVATGVAVALMLTRFPSEQRVRAWLERQTECLAELRQGERLSG